MKTISTCCSWINRFHLQLAKHHALTSATKLCTWKKAPGDDSDLLAVG